MDLKFSKIVSQEKRKAEMLLYGLIGQEINGSYFAQELSYLTKNYEEVCIRVNSDGGLVTDGFGILAVMLASPARIVVHIDGVAASMAAVVVAGADEVLMNDFALLMIHSPYFVDDKDEKVTTLSAKDKVVLTNLTNSMVQLLTKRGLTDEEARKMMKQDTWFNAEQALEAKLVDRIVETGRKMELAAMAPKRLVATILKEHTNTDNIEMKKVISTLKLPEVADEAAVVAAIEQLQAAPAKVDLLVGKLLAVGRSLGTVTDQNEASMKKLAATDVQLLDLFPVDAKAPEGPAAVAAADQVRLSEVLASFKGGGAPVQTDSDRFAEMEKKGPQALAAWKASNAAEYNKCFKAFWGEEPK